MQNRISLSTPTVTWVWPRLRLAFLFQPRPSTCHAPPLRVVPKRPSLPTISCLSCLPALQFQSAAGTVDSADFLPLLRRLDDCIAYVAANPQYADAATYAVKFRQLQARALTAVRTKVQQVLRTAAAQVAAAVREGHGGTAAAANGAAAAGAGAAAGARGQPATPALAAPLPDGAEAALLYVRFRAAAEPALKGLLQGIEQRAQQSQASEGQADVCACVA